jgi:hypothetical protein
MSAAEARGLKKKKRIKAVMKQVRCEKCLGLEKGCPKPLKCAKKFKLMK